MLSTRAVALQGIGFGPRVLALQGFADIPVEVMAATGADGRRIETQAAQSVDFTLQARAEDEILLAVITQAVTTGMLSQWQRH